MKSAIAGWKKRVLLVLAVSLFFVLSFVAYSALPEDAQDEFVYREGDIVRLIPEGYDIDNDTISYVFSSPLNQSGEWQTGFKDAGSYEVTVSAFDGKAYTEEKVTVIVENVNRAPEIEAEDIEVVETELAVLEYEVSDPDGDKVSVRVSEPFDERGEWQTDFDDAGEHEVSITASDGKLETTSVVTVTVLNRNRVPNVADFLPVGDAVRIKENEEASFFAEGSDPDNEEVSYAWFVDDAESGAGQDFTYETDFESSGEHEVKVEISDGEDKSAHGWKVVVENVNRAPDLAFLEDIAVDETEVVDLGLPSTDVDGDELEYIIDEPIGDDGIWETTYEDAGEYEIDVIVNDGELMDEKVVRVEVVDVDRAPEFENISDVVVREDEKMRVELDAVDADGDEISFSFSGLPNSSVLAGDEIKWQPGYDFILLPKNFIAKTLSRFRVDDYIYPEEEMLDVFVEACGKELCSNRSFKVLVQNVNRAPVLEKVEELVVDEGSLVEIKPNASDPDNEYVKFYYTAPVGKNGKWATNFTDAGSYEVIVGATDGKQSVETRMRITVDNVNRLPVFGSWSNIKLKENETVSFSVPVSDSDGDLVKLTAEGLPEDASFKAGVLSWTPSFNEVNKGEAKAYNITFSADDGINESVTKAVVLTVENANRAPVVVDASPAASVNATAGKGVVFKVNAADPDGDELKYKWKFGFLDSISDGKAVKRTFTQPGSKNVEVIVSDGDKEASYLWNVNVPQPKVVKKAVKPAPKVEEKPAAKPKPKPQPKPKPAPKPAPKNETEAKYLTFIVEG